MHIRETHLLARLKKLPGTSPTVHHFANGASSGALDVELFLFTNSARNQKIHFGAHRGLMSHQKRNRKILSFAPEFFNCMVQKSSPSRSDPA